MWMRQFRKCASAFLSVLPLLLFGAIYFGTNTVKTKPSYNQVYSRKVEVSVPITMATTFGLPPEYLERRRRVEQVCKTKETSGVTQNILVYRNMSYCVVAKAGCTFWIRVFRFLHNDTSGRHLENPFQMTRDQAHGFKNIRLYRLQNKTDKEVVMDTVRFLVARNPFTRLFSAYMDKLYLPGLWSQQGKSIASQIRNTSLHSLQCGHDVSFSEFLTYVARVGKINPHLLNGHWRPIGDTCDPCTFKPHIIAKQETFSYDSEFILNRFGLGHLLWGYKHANHVIDEISIITDSNYNQGAGCINRKELALRLWKTFQVNGYLRPGSQRVLDKESEESLSKDRLKGLMIKEYESRPLSGVESRAQRAAYLKEEYEKVPKSVLQEIIRVFQDDFDFFGYPRHTFFGVLNVMEMF